MIATGTWDKSRVGSLDDLRHLHYLHISQDVLPYLRDRGVTEGQIDAMLVRNPTRILAG